MIGYGKAKTQESKTLLDSMKYLSKQLYALRLTSVSLGLNLELIEPQRLMSIVDGAVALDFKEYLERVCHKNGKAASADNIMRLTEVWLQKIINHDVRYCCRGHDFIEILSWTIENLNGDKKASKTLYNALRLLVSHISEELAACVQSSGA